MADVTLSAFSRSSPADRRWWASAVFYQIYPRSFADGNGDGTGDLIGVRQRLDHLVELGVDAIWLSPFYRSPMADGGYDVADPCDVDPLFGTLADFDALLAGAHERGIRVTIDIVPNHFSDQHVWFQQALAAGPGSRERARFIFRPGRGPDGELPPNNWPSAFGGPAWTRLPDGEWYLHLFAPEQPDLDWTNPDVPAEFERIVRFWLDRGADGFRVDVAHGIAKEPGLPDMDLSIITSREHGPHFPTAADLRFDRDAVHEHHAAFRRILDSYHGDRMAVGEAWVRDPTRLARYAAPGGLNLTFNFELVQVPWAAEAFRSRSTGRCTRCPQSARRAPGCSPTTTSTAPRPATATARPGWPAPARQRWCNCRCPEPPTSTTATNSGWPTSTCRTRRCRIRRGNAAATRFVAGMASGCRCRGPAPDRRTGSPPARPGCRCPATGPG